MYNKHAYLIMVHNQIELISDLMKMIDDERNDIYIHIDAKSSLEKDEIKSKIHKSSIYFIDNRIDVRWGDISIVQATYGLLKSACNHQKYAYYHLLSGADLPIKSQDYIHSFFNESTYEYIHFAPEKIRANHNWRYDYKWRNTELFKDRSIKGRINKVLCYLYIGLQYFMQQHRCEDRDFQTMHGSAWFSITDDFARYVLTKEEWVEQRYRQTLLPDESFIQTLVYNSSFRENLYIPVEQQVDDDHGACLRLIDWKRGGPYVWKNENLDELLESKCLFARKFDLNVDRCKCQYKNALKVENKNVGFSTC